MLNISPKYGLTPHSDIRQRESRVSSQSRLGNIWERIIYSKRPSRTQEASDHSSSWMSMGHVFSRAFWQRTRHGVCCYRNRNQNQSQQKIKPLNAGMLVPKTLNCIKTHLTFIVLAVCQNQMIDSDWRGWGIRGYVYAPLKHESLRLKENLGKL